jgi:hypothetical protein
MNDPQGQNLGHGLTGVSGAAGAEPEQGTPARRVREQMDLSPRHVGNRLHARRASTARLHAGIVDGARDYPRRSQRRWAAYQRAGGQVVRTRRFDPG